MANKKNKTDISDERMEDTTLYGEFISSFHQWMTPDRQKRTARHHESITDPGAPEKEKKRSD